MKIEWSVTNVTAVSYPDRAERAICTILGMILAEPFFGQFNVPPVGSPNRAEQRAILGVILAGHFLAKSGHICGQGATL